MGSIGNIVIKKHVIFFGQTKMEKISKNRQESDCVHVYNLAVGI